MIERRALLKALALMPAGTKLSVKEEPKPKEMIVLEAPGSISEETADRLSAYCKKHWPGRTVVVLGDGMKLKVVPEPKP